MKCKFVKKLKNEKFRKYVDVSTLISTKRGYQKRVDKIERHQGKLVKQLKHSEMEKERINKAIEEIELLIQEKFNE